jgi:hypothetical protein
VTNSMLVTLLRGGVHLILANPPWRQLQERAEKIPGDKKHVEEDTLIESLRRAVQYSTESSSRAATGDSSW